MFSFGEKRKIIVLQEKTKKIIKIPVPQDRFQSAGRSRKKQVRLKQNLKEITLKKRLNKIKQKNPKV